jgi:hypothetical protein
MNSGFAEHRAVVELAATCIRDGFDDVMDDRPGDFLNLPLTRLSVHTGDPGLISAGKS